MLSQAKRAGGEPISKIANSIDLLIIAILIKIDSKGPLIYWSDRIGRYNRIFKMPKFRSMVENSPLIASHLLE